MSEPKKTQKQIRSERAAACSEIEYTCHYWQGFNYAKLNKIYCYARRRKDEWISYSDAIIMADTETSKERINDIDDHGSYIPVPNYVCAWSIAIRAYATNICCLWGAKPSDFMRCLALIRKNLRADNMILYWHNMSYDWVFMRQYIMAELGTPDEQLNVKPHYPIQITWENAGIIMKDSLILAQRSLERWAKDLQVEHQKAVGSWDYLKIRDQSGDFSDDELLYIQNDVLAGVECIEKTMELLGKNLMSMPYTATGIPREDLRKLGQKQRAHDFFLRVVNSWDIQKVLQECLFHGGYVHGNRHLLNTTLTKELLGWIMQCFDFASSYPFCLLAFKYPVSKFYPIGNASVKEILEKGEKFCFYFKLVMIHLRLKDYDHPMPALQYSKCLKCVNPILDNGRILTAEYAEIYLTEIDLEVIDELYTWDKHICTDVHYAEKGRLPKYLTDYIYGLFKDKCELKGKDELLYTLQKYKLNAASFGLMAQRPLKEDITEDYDTGENTIHNWDDAKYEEEYEKYIKKRGSIFNYPVGCWITAYALRNLFKLGKCCAIWGYSDTDSVYGAGWDLEKVAAYNEWCKQLIKEAGYGPVIVNGKEYHLGVAEHEDLKDDYSEFRIQGAKRYCGRCLKDGELHITVAGVPKKLGALELNDDINNFKPGFVFKGENTGKKTYIYFFEEKKMKNGIEYGDSIDLIPCDYKLDGVTDIVGWEDIIYESSDMPTYGEEYIYDYGGTETIGGIYE